MTMRYRNLSVGDVDVAYREAGPHDAPVILLLHGFPTAGHMFRDLMPALATKYRVIAPDLPGFGKTRAPPRGAFEYSFDNMADVIAEFVETLGLDRYALYIFDYGAPVGLRLAMKHPERVTAIVTQNGNAYEEGLAISGDHGRPIGANRPTLTARRAAARSAATRSAHSIYTAPRRNAFLPTDTRSTCITWNARARRKSSSTWS